MSVWLYTLLTSLVYILFLPLTPFLALKERYRKSIPARFWLWKNSPFEKRLIHFHSCSLGETRALKPLVEHFDEVNISVITQTGKEAAKEYKNANVRYLPFEPLLWWWLKPQKVLVVMEAELWYLLFFLSKRRGAKTFLINARISQKSYPKYRKFRWLYKRVFENIDFVYAQSDEDKERLEELGAKDVEVIGNIKLLSKPTITKRYEKSKKILTAASTHDPEEEIIATAFIESGLKDEYSLVVVPRHPERFDEVDELLSFIAKREELSYHRLSQKKSLEADIVLVDRMGELNNIYAVSDVVILAGSFIDGIGGHNPIEPAYFAKPIISGPYYFNQISSYASVEGIEVIEASKIKDCLRAKAFKNTKITQKVNVKKVLEKLEML